MPKLSPEIERELVMARFYASMFLENPDKFGDLQVALARQFTRLDEKEQRQRKANADRSMLQVKKPKPGSGRTVGALDKKPRKKSNKRARKGLTK